MRKPNGYGSVYKLNGNRRNPFIARVTSCIKKGKQKYSIIGTFATRKEAETALAQYHINPISERPNVTISDLYDEVILETTASKSFIDNMKSSYTHLSKLHNVKIKDIKLSHLKAVFTQMQENNLSHSTQSKVKILLSKMYTIAMGDDIVNKDYSKLISIKREDTVEKQIFNDFEIKRMFDHVDKIEWLDTVLILIFTGMRINEFLNLNKFNVDINKMVITGGIKSDAGKNRVIPIHSKIQPFILKYYNQSDDYLILRNNNRINDQYYRNNLYKPALDNLGVRILTPHCCRHTFASLMNKSVDNKVYIQKIMGHTDYNTTANIYTHSDIEELRNAIEKI